ncbi:MAG: hypothetical protein GKR90_26765 [Pseudomonadales bacterium]|nr:hypothetical protein [Pseudomonadales bacterium]
MGNDSSNLVDNIETSLKRLQWARMIAIVVVTFLFSGYRPLTIEYLLVHLEG